MNMGEMILELNEKIVCEGKYEKYGVGGNERTPLVKRPIISASRRHQIHHKRS